MNLHHAPQPQSAQGFMPLAPFLCLGRFVRLRIHQVALRPACAPSAPLKRVDLRAERAPALRADTRKGWRVSDTPSQ